MPIYSAPLDDMRFLLQHVFKLQHTLADIPQYQEMDSELLETVLAEGAKFAESELFPLNQSGDEESCRYENHKVTTPKGFKEAFSAMSHGGWNALSADPHFGGQGLPKAVQYLFEEILCSSNLSFSLFPSLTHGVVRGIHSHANESIKQLYLPNLIKGEWTGTMCLTEAHCGSDLSLLQCKTSENDDGSYALSGTKIFITAGEQDLTNNIIHLVLARLPGAPEGIQGISLFLVPKILVDSEGNLGEPNSLYCTAIEHKMGLRGSPTCTMHFDKATAFLISQPHQGMQAMFTVMNTERLAIGIQGTGVAETAYQNAHRYAQERLQGRSPKGALYPEKNADPIIVHPDVRRMLLKIKTFTEGSRALACWTALELDLSEKHPDERVRESSQQRVAFLTPLFKAYATEQGTQSCSLAMQIFGGHGYITESGIEQYLRDIRIAEVYEGSNGIQTIDLIKRKLVKTEGLNLNAFLNPIAELLKNMDVCEKFSSHFNDYQSLINDYRQVSEWILENHRSDPELIYAVAYDYLYATAFVALGYVWLKQSEVIDNLEAAAKVEKEQSIHFFFQYSLPEANMHIARIYKGVVV